MSYGTIETIAQKLDLAPQELERESLRLFLQHQLRLIDSQRFQLAQKYGVRTIEELDQQVQKGYIHEDKAFEDYFELDYLEAKREILLDSLKELA